MNRLIGYRFRLEARATVPEPFPQPPVTFRRGAGDTVVGRSMNSLAGQGSA